MTEREKKAISLMRENGYSYSDISKQLGLSENTVKSFGRRKKLEVKHKQILPFCKECRFPIQQNPKTKRRIFCCNKCKQKWWNRQRCKRTN